MATVFAFFCFFGLKEFYTLTQNRTNTLGIVGGMSIYTLSFVIANNTISTPFFALVIGLVVLALLQELFDKNAKEPFQSAATTVFGWVYVCAPFSMLSFLTQYPNAQTYTYQIVLAIFLFLWTSDTGAYLVGKTIGKTKLFERISPNKSVEGVLGGLVLTLLVAYFGVSPHFDVLHSTQWLVISGLVVVFGVLGDLVESMLKRSVGAKDSGAILVGHGGVLDRFDSFILAVPLVFIYLMLK